MYEYILQQPKTRTLKTFRSKVKRKISSTIEGWVVIEDITQF